MKKLMFAAALVASISAFADFEFAAEPGVYNLTFTQKVLQPTYGFDRAEGSLDSDACATKRLAKLDAQEKFDTIKSNYPNYKIDDYLYSDAGEDYYICTLCFSYDDYSSDMIITGGKIVNESFAGIIIKNDDGEGEPVFEGEDVTDGAFLLWPKSLKINGKYQAVSYDYPWVQIATYGNKAAGDIYLHLVQYVSGMAIDRCTELAGLGTAANGYVKSISGGLTQYDYDETEGAYAGYGTWKLSKDTAATRLAAAGNDLETILYKKGAVEVAIAGE